VARQRSGLIRASGRRRRGWSDGPGGTGVTTFTASAHTILGSGAVSLLDGQTIARIRGALAITMVSATAAGDGFSGAIGIGIASETAFGIGVTAVNDPVAEADWDGWIWHSFIQVFAGDKTAGDVNWGVANLRMEVDSKAMRKLPESQTVYCSMQLTEIGTSEIDVFFDSRLLVLLP